MKVGDQVKFKPGFYGLEKIIGIILVAHKDSVLVQWSNYEGYKNPNEESKPFLEKVNEDW